MGKTSKFSFPIPGRRHAAKEVAIAPPEVARDKLSKAQRILGTTNNLNIDHPSSRSSFISISVSDSTYSSSHDSQHGDWDREPVPRSRGVTGKASSTLLGPSYGEDDRPSTMADERSRLRNEDSSSTLRSYYDRQKSPMAISQQTSASSQRDLALRKGLPAIQRSPLLQVETSIDPFDKYIQEQKGSEYESRMAAEKKKKPARLDLSMLFPKSLRHGGKSSGSDYLTPSPSSASTSGSRQDGSSHPNSGSSRRRLKKSRSKESISSQKLSIHSQRSPELRPSTGTPSSLSDHYEHLVARSHRMDIIRESEAPDGIQDDGDGQYRSETLSMPAKSTPDQYLSPSHAEPFSWKNVRSGVSTSSLTPPAWEATSAASISSRNTRTSNSALSHSDLQEKSVLSLSSDSEGDSDTDLDLSGTPSSRCKPSIKKSSSQSNDGNSRSLQHPEGLTSSNYGQKRYQTQPGPPRLSVRESTIAKRISGPWTPSQLDTPPTSSHQKDFQDVARKEKRASNRPSSERTGIPSQHKKGPSTVSSRSIQQLQQPTPPLSPSSMIFRQSSERSNRFMAVTRQEEALLEAMRQKRARMREEIIEQHETAKSPPRIMERTSKSSVRTARDSTGKESILLCLDTPLSQNQIIDTAEPSPNLDDFMTFEIDEVDEDRTPRASLVPPERGQPKPESIISVEPKPEKSSRSKAKSAARLSAVGAAKGFKNDDRSSSESVAKRRTTGVRFVDDGKIGANLDLLLDDDEPMLWNV